jgi:hypothetical protein
MGGAFQVFFGALRMPPVVLLISLGIAFAIGLLVRLFLRTTPPACRSLMRCVTWDKISVE